ncbi:DUF1566 domain-containing protein [Acinetobacter johnsonii]|uniref:Lcl C-terminal domain-containing protein n=1 Tax=Acinetobacter johnsonii TaxID=40214 RepID=UPI001CCC374D|nr:DUF1566 domain-containing protein [Acinetobacter johnsonii]UBQ36798.1 DUF1566 domain-containing protein [Acinetobacter johnsonii]
MKLTNFNDFFTTKAEANIVESYLKLLAENNTDFNAQIKHQKMIIEKESDFLLEQVEKVLVNKLDRIEHKIKRLDEQCSESHEIVRRIDQFTELESGVWTDPKNNLMWSRISIGQKWVKGEVIGESLVFAFDQVDKICMDSRFAGFSDWRLPTQEELERLKLAENEAGFKYQQEILFKPQNNIWGKYWSSSSDENGDPIFINFEDGKPYVPLSNTYTNYIRLVRSTRSKSKSWIDSIVDTLRRR